MRSTIHRLVYYSRNRVSGSPEATAENIRQILSASRRNNPRVNLSGALMFNAGCFAQVLEGSREDVAHGFERIQQDGRHSDVLVLSFAPAPERVFNNWSMAFVGGSVEDAVRYGSVASESGYDPSRMSGEALFETLHRLVQEQEALSV